MTKKGFMWHCGNVILIPNLDISTSSYCMLEYLQQSFLPRGQFVSKCMFGNTFTAMVELESKQPYSIIQPHFGELRFLSLPKP